MANIELFQDPFYSKGQMLLIGMASVIAITGIALLISNCYEENLLNSEATFYTSFAAAGCGVIPIGAFLYSIIKQWPQSKSLDEDTQSVQKNCVKEFSGWVLKEDNLF